MLTKKKYLPLKLTPVTESKSSENIAGYAKKLLDKFEPYVVWDVVNATQFACVLLVGNRHGLFSSIDKFIGAIENIGKLPGVNMVDLGSFEERGFKHVGRGFTIKDSSSFFSELLRKMKANCENELRDAEVEFLQADESEKNAAEVWLKHVRTEFKSLEIMAKEIVNKGIRLS